MDVRRLKHEESFFARPTQSPPPTSSSKAITPAPPNPVPTTDTPAAVFASRLLGVYVDIDAALGSDQTFSLQLVQLGDEH